MTNSSYIRELLTSKSIKTIDLAKKIGISQPTLNRKIQGKTKFTEKDIRILLEVLNMTYEEVFNHKISVIKIDNKTFVVNKKKVKKIMDIIKNQEVI
jgi:transcriptional regulator with XRE-family HTH domain